MYNYSVLVLDELHKGYTMKRLKVGLGFMVALMVVGVVVLAIINKGDTTTNADRNLASEVQNEDASNTVEDQANRLLESGNMAYENHQFDQAVRDYSTALELEYSDDALSAELYYRRALAQIEIGAWDLAIRDFSLVIENETLPVDAYVGRGDLYYRMGEYDNALADVESALNIDPANSAALVTRAAVYLAQDQHTEAVQDLQTVVNVDADYAPAYFYRSVANYNVGEQFAALQDLNQAIQLDSQNAAAHYLRGLVYEKEGGDNIELALADYSRAIQLDPMYSAAYRSRSWIYARQGQIANSRSDRQNAMLVDPTVAGISVGDYDLEITRVWATDRANDRRPENHDQFLIFEISVYNYATTELCLHRTDFTRLRGPDRVLPTLMYHVGQQYYPGMTYPPGSNDSRQCIPSLSILNTFLTYDTDRDIQDITLEFSPVDETTSLSLLLLPTDEDYAFALSALNDEPITIVGDVVITEEVRTKVLESRTAIVDNCLGGGELSRTDTLEHEEAFNIEVQTTVRTTTGNGAQFESAEANSIRITPPIPYIGRLLPIQISDLKINLTGQIGQTNIEETTTTETTSRMIRSSIAVTTTAAPGTRESTLVTWYLVNKLGYVETNINGTLYQMPFSITDTLEADPVGLPPETCDAN